MKFACAAVLLVAVGCHKGTNAANSGSAAAGSAVAGSADTGSGSATTGSAMAGSSATAGSAAASPLVGAVDELDRYLAPIMKLEVHPRIVALAKVQPALLAKVEALGAVSAPAGVDAAAWSDAVGNLKTQIDGVGLCMQDLPKYDKMSKAAQAAADDGYEECTAKLPEAFAAVVKLVPGAKPPGTHAGDPVMKP